MKISLKKSILAVCGFAIGTLAFSQQLTFNDLINIRQKKVEEVEKAMSSKKWTADKDEQTNNSDELVLKLENRKHEVTQMLSLAKDTEGNVLTYQTANKSGVTKIEGELIKEGYTFISKSLNNEKESITYMKDNVKVTILTLSSETNPQPVYIVTVKS